MNPNHVELLRVYSREVGGVIADETFSSGTPVEIAVDCEAGATIFGLGVPFTLTIHVRGPMENFEAGRTQTIDGTLGSTEWPTLARTHKFRVEGPFLQAGHVFSVLAVLTVGVADPKPIADFAESNRFLMA